MFTLQNRVFRSAKLSIGAGWGGGGTELAKMSCPSARLHRAVIANNLVLIAGTIGGGPVAYRWLRGTYRWRGVYLIDLATALGPRFDL